MRSALDDVMVLMDQAALKLPADKLAELARAIPDDDLADMVRSNPDLRRFALMVLVQEQLGGSSRANGKVAKPNGKSKPRAASRTSRSNGARGGSRKPRPTEKLRQEGASKVDDLAQSMLAAIVKSGEDGISPRDLAAEVGCDKVTLARRGQTLVDAGKARVEGTTNSRRWYAA